MYVSISFYSLRHEGFHYERGSMACYNSYAHQWHPAFFASWQIEFQEESGELTFKNEHMIGTKPKQIDVLVIKKSVNKTIKKNIGRIFRMHNIIEYKSPEDYLSIDDFYKCYGYVCFYKSDGNKQNEINISEITLTLVSSGFPRNLVNHLKQVRGWKVEKIERGIYYVSGNIFPIQIINTKKLSKEKNLWLKSLNLHLESKDMVNSLIQEYDEHKDEKLYNSAMDIIVKNNIRIFKEVNENMLCAALEDLIKERLEREVKIALDEAVSKAVNKEVNIAVDKAVSQTTDNILNALEEIHNQIPISEIRKKYHLSEAEWIRMEKLALY